MAYIDSVKDSVMLHIPGTSSRDLTSRNSQNVACGNPHCPGGWMQRWKNHRRPFFEGRWACSGSCLSQLVTMATRREMGSTLALSESSPHRHRIPLGLILMSQGLINPVQLQIGLERQRIEGSGRIGEHLMQNAGVSEARITRALSIQWNCPMLTTEGFSPERMARIAPPAVLTATDMLPISVVGSRVIYLAFESELNPAAALAVEQMTNLRIHYGLLPSTQFREARRRLNECASAPVKEERAFDQDCLVKGISSVIAKEQPVASRLVRIGSQYWLRMWLEEHALSGGPGELVDDVFDCVWTLQS